MRQGHVGSSKRSKHRVEAAVWAIGGLWRERETPARGPKAWWPTSMAGTGAAELRVGGKVLPPHILMRRGQCVQSQEPGAPAA